LSPQNISNKAVALLSDYHWPGNIRELENFLERLMNETNAAAISDPLVSRHMQRLIPHQPFSWEEGGANASAELIPLRQLERYAIKKAVDHYGWSVDGKKRAASSLGVSLATLYNKLKEYHLIEGK
jgi:transcriptional regulator with PAS, ATPase and Fis domain